MSIRRPSRAADGPIIEVATALPAAPAAVPDAPAPVARGHLAALQQRHLSTLVVSPRPRLGALRVVVVIAIVAVVIRFITGVVVLAQTQTMVGIDPDGRSARLLALQVPESDIQRLRDLTATADLATVVSFLLIVLAFVFVVRWQNVPLRNQWALGIHHPRYGPMAAGWSWFVPIWSFFGPKSAYNDLWRVAAPIGVRDTSEPRPDPSHVPRLFHAWWAAWLGAAVLLSVASRVPDVTLGNRQTSQALESLSALVLLVAGVLFLTVVERITARHDELVRAAGG